MKYFIFPTNYNRKEKFLGLIEYKSIAVVAGWGICVFSIIKSCSFPVLMKIYLFLFVFGIPAILLLVGFNGENMVDVLRYLLCYILNPKVYVYSKKSGKKGGDL